jgi:crotonobetainyl-CoA:carnitine CoA-transferase CaiB-like acyl-CoA transferase
MGGLMSVTGEEGGPLLRSGAPLIDMSTPLSAALAVLAALMTRQRTGIGQKVEASLLAQGLFIQGPMFAYASHIGANPPRMGNRSPMALILEATTPTGGFLVGIPTERLWTKLCATLERPDLADRPEFASHALRLTNQVQLAAEIEPMLGDRPREAWLARLVEAGVPCAPVNDYAAAVAEPQVAAIGAFLDLDRAEEPEGAADHSTGGGAGDAAIRLPNVPWRIDGHGATIRHRPPTLGRDTVAVLREYGFSDDDIRGLEETGVTRGAFVDPGQSEEGR